MKNIIFLFLLFISGTLTAQVPQKMSYQAIIRDVNNNLLSQKKISIRISILRGTLETTAVYTESHNGRTNLNGLISLQIGTGQILFGIFSKIDWSKGPYFIFTETDPDGGFDYRIKGKSELLSVPFALYAGNNSTFDTTSLHTRIIDLQSQAIENKNDIENNLDSIKENAKDIKKNLDSISVHGLEIDHNIDVIKINTVQIKNNIDSINTKVNLLDLIAILSSYQKIDKLVNAITLDGNDGNDVKSIGNFSSSKNITLNGNIESIGDSSTIGSLTNPFKDLYISSHSLYIASDEVGQNIPPTVLSNVSGNLEISLGGIKLMGVNSAFIAPRIVGTLTGNASTATKLFTARTINGINFDGSSNIIIPTSINNALSFNATGTGDEPGGIFDGTVTKTLSYNSIGAAPSEGSTSLTMTGQLLKLTLQSNKSEEQLEELDLTKSIHKLIGMENKNYILKDGYEGQVIYLLPFGERTSLKDITIQIDNCTIWISDMLVTSNKDRPIIWTPFNDKRSSITMVAALFTENKWFIAEGTTTY
jgi:hypothetical protein